MPSGTQPSDGPGSTSQCSIAGHMSLYGTHDVGVGAQRPYVLSRLSRQLYGLPIGSVTAAQSAFMPMRQTFWHVVG